MDYYLFEVVAKAASDEIEKTKKTIEGLTHVAEILEQKISDDEEMVEKLAESIETIQSAPHLPTDEEHHDAHVDNYVSIRKEYLDNKAKKLESRTKEAITSLLESRRLASPAHKLGSTQSLSTLKQNGSPIDWSDPSTAKIDFLKKTVDFLKKQVSKKEPLTTFKDKVAKESNLKSLFNNLRPTSVHTLSAAQSEPNHDLLSLFGKDLQGL